MMDRRQNHNLSVSLERRFCEESAMPQVVPSDKYSTLPEIVHHFVIPVKKKKTHVGCDEDRARRYVHKVKDGMGTGEIRGHEEDMSSSRKK
jgi:hypothetical protein